MSFSREKTMDHIHSSVHCTILFCIENAYQKCITHCEGRFFFSFALLFLLFDCCFVLLNDSSVWFRSIFSLCMHFIRPVCLSSFRLPRVLFFFVAIALPLWLHIYFFYFLRLRNFPVPCQSFSSCPPLFSHIALELSYLSTICSWKYPL